MKERTDQSYWRIYSGDDGRELAYARRTEGTILGEQGELSTAFPVFYLYLFVAL